MDYNHIYRKQPSVACQWVMWYGDFLYSQVDYRSIITFETGMEKMLDKIKIGKDEVFNKAVIQASKVKTENPFLIK